MPTVNEFARLKAEIYVKDLRAIGLQPTRKGYTHVLNIWKKQA